jgi:hypothetical protein
MAKMVWEDELLKALKIYERELSEFIYKPMSPAMLERMKDKIKAVSHHFANMDRNDVWLVPVEIVPTGPGTFELRPDLTHVTVHKKPGVPF